MATASGQPFDIILMDLHMPVMTGFEATGILRNMGLRTPIIAVTADPCESCRDQARKSGCDGWLTKPITPESLMHEVGRHLTGMLN